MSVITTGEMRQIFYKPETSYGVTPTGALVFGGKVEKLKDGSNYQVKFEAGSGSRQYVCVTRGPIKTLFTWTAKLQAVSTVPAYEWISFWPTNSMGDVLALTDHLPSFSFQQLIQQTVAGVTTSHYFLVNGCKLNKTSIEGTNPGESLLFTADIIGKVMQYSTSKVFAGYQNVTVGADATIPTTLPIVWKGPLQYNLNAGGLTTWKPRSWKLTIDNHLEPQPASEVGADGSQYYLDAGTIQEGPRDIIFECILPYEMTQLFENAKRTGLPMTSLTIPIDARVITLTGGVFEANDFPEYVQGVNKENIKLRFTGMSIA